MPRSIKKLRKDALMILRSAIRAADPYDAVRSQVSLHGNTLIATPARFDMRRFDRIFIIGMGKGSARMAQAIEAILGDRITAGLAVVKDGYIATLEKVEIREAGHPIPDARGQVSARKITDILKKTGERDLVIVLICGGGSALLPAPQEGITLRDKQKMTGILLHCGATIREINALRKHLSTLKGGRLARLAFPSTILSLILSDIVGDPIDAIASGPTAPDVTTFGDCMAILKKYDVVKKTPDAVLKFIKQGLKGAIEETPKKGDPAFLRTHNFIVGNNFRSLKAASQKATQLGYNTLILSSMIEGETRDAAKFHASIGKEILRSGNPVSLPACIISGGETTVTIRGTGLGGRNQEFALASAIEISGLGKTVVLSAGSDGTDGPTDAAGALADSSTVQRAKKKKIAPLLYLENNDSYRFFKKLDGLVVTGPTNTNVMDVRIMLVER